MFVNIVTIIAVHYTGVSFEDIHSTQLPVCKGQYSDYHINSDKNNFARTIINVTCRPSCMKSG